MDLGCGAGSWSLYASTRVGPSGFVIAIDSDLSFLFNTLSSKQFSKNIQSPLNIYPCKTDIYEITRGKFPRDFDVVMSDLAPSTMGDHHTDALNSTKLADKALSIALDGLKFNNKVGGPRGVFICKVLEGKYFEPFVEEVEEYFQKVKISHSKIRRDNSAETFVIASGIKEKAIKDRLNFK